ncbi:alpha/beta hydrolase [Mycolicibacterium celeriflavum]|uniref:alpha/beta hydrolase family protein n=1 Tax=Mycolicibacterium celeriflavum TaxID=1249101 RepID=UPI003CF59A36
MVDRFLMWLSAGVVTAGMSAAMLVGAGVAVADDGPSSGAGASDTSESSNSTDSTKDSVSPPSSTASGARTSAPTSTGTTDGAPRTRVGAKRPDEAADDAKKSDTERATDGRRDRKTPGPGRKDADAAATQANDTEAPAKEDDGPAKEDDGATGEAAVDGMAPEGADAEVVDQVIPEEEAAVEEVVAKSRSDRDETAEQATAVVSRNAARIAADDTAARTVTDKTADKTAATAVVDAEIDDGVQSPEERTTVVVDEPIEDPVELEFAVQPIAFATASPAVTTVTAPQIPNIIRVIGTIVFDLYGLATRIFGGPPILPANSTVTVRSSTLRIDCACAEGEGQEVPADWYIPKTAEGAPPPDRMIYLQHGFLATGPWYSHTAATLAERTNSIVVAPTITSNFFALDGCWLGGAPMHEAMAGLFDKRNDALADSARAAGYDGRIPDRVVLMGHSLGGGAVSGIAGHMADDSRIDRLAGVVLLDGVALGDPARMTASLRNVPLDIPIYQLAAPVYMWNNFGAGLDALAAARPTGFIGVTLVNGSHVDAMRGGNPLIQFGQELVAGFSRPENSAAAQMLMVGWVNDMFDPTGDDGLYLERGERYSFDTPAGRATVVALPNTLTKPFLLNFLRPFMSLANGLFSLDPVCVRESVGSAGAGHCGDTIAA